jgi:hypothetical protein
VVNNTAYGDGLDSSVGQGQAPEFSSYYSSTVHFVNDLAYGRTASASVYMNLASTVSWSHNVGFNGSVSGADAVTGEPSVYQYRDPLLNNPPPTPSGARPWARATPPWEIGGALGLRANSPALRAGINPADLTGVSPSLAAALQLYIGASRLPNPPG